MRRLSRDPEELPWLEIDADLDGEAGVPFETLVGWHGAGSLRVRADTCRVGRRACSRVRGPWSVVASRRARRGNHHAREDRSPGRRDHVHPVVAVHRARIPKKHPGFPRRLDLFLVLSGLLFVAQMSAVVWVTGTQEVEHEATARARRAGQRARGDDRADRGSPAAGDPVAGKAVFASAGCASCHTLADARRAGSVGPNLDDLHAERRAGTAIVP